MINSIIILFLSTFLYSSSNIYSSMDNKSSRTTYVKNEKNELISKLFLITDDKSYTTYYYKVCKQLNIFEVDTNNCEKIDINIKENISENAAKSFIDIVKHFKLEKEIRKLNSFRLVYGGYNGLIYHAPIILNLNNDRNFPKNIKMMYKRNKISAEIFFNISRDNIKQSKLFEPLQEEFKKLGCELKMDKYFTDGWNLDISKEELIKKGLLSREEAKKEFYPTFNQGIIFNLNCAK